uniref:FXYD domain-containing ion transport regulator n=1 Tax=Poecilia latipinna TaxID=48699 RepID=A0A3B3UQS7_9TELE
MGHLSLVTLLAGNLNQENIILYLTHVFIAGKTLFYYERLRIGGLIFACMLIAGAVGLLFCKCSKDKKYTYIFSFSSWSQLSRYLQII